MRDQLFDFRLGSMRERLAKGRLAMVVYPVFAIVAVMSLTDGRVYWSAKSFLIACLFYPVVYFACFEAALVARRKGKRVTALTISGVPLWYFGVLAALAVVALIFDGT
jgi:hypothetical protein